MTRWWPALEAVGAVRAASTRGDRPSTWPHRVLAGVMLAGLVGFLYPLVGVLEELTEWETAWRQPAVAAELVRCMVSALVAMGAAAGLNVPNLLRGFGVSVGEIPPGKPPAGV